VGVPSFSSSVLAMLIRSEEERMAGILIDEMSALPHDLFVMAEKMTPCKQAAVC
jgi:hypothetical protein